MTETMLSHDLKAGKSADSALAPETGRNRSADSGTVNRVLRMLSCFAENERWGVNDLAKALGLPKATAHRLLNLCIPLNFITQDESGAYKPGLALYRLAGKLATEMPINKLAEPILRDIRDHTDETVLLVLLDRPELQMYFSLSASPAHPLRYTILHNRLQPLSWGASARSLLAFLEPEEIEEVVRRADPSPLTNRPLDSIDLRHSLTQIREQGYALSYAERAPDSHGIAVPFFDNHGQVRGNLTLTIPGFRFDQAKLPEWIDLLKRSGSALTALLGWS
jgi:IclR family KDG regulon transcriptional repressor